MSSSKKVAAIANDCVACGCCAKVCPLSAISVYKGLHAVVDKNRCIGCGKCAGACPAAVISISQESTPHSQPKTQNRAAKQKKRPHKKHWYDYLWIAEVLYLTSGFFNILFAWMGLIFFFTPLMISIIWGTKSYCGKYCGRGQLFELVGGNFGLSQRRKPPQFLRSKWLRYGFLAFFLTTFALMLHNTYLVFAGAALKETLLLFWVFKLPWDWLPLAPAHGYASLVSPWVAKFGFGLYGVMLTSTIIGFITMIIFKPRTWCVYCPMGSMTQIICKIKQ